MPIAIVGKGSCPRREWKIDVIGAEELEAVREHTNDGVRSGVEIDGFAEHICGAAKTAAPQAVADDYRGCAASAVLVGAKGTAEMGVYSEKGKKPRGYPARIEALGFAGTREGDRGAAHTLDGFERMTLVTPVDEILVGDAGIGKFALFSDQHNAGGIAKGKRAQQNGINDAEDCGVCADAEGEREDGDRREGRTFNQEAESVAKILQQNFHDTPTREAILAFFDGRGAGRFCGFGCGRNGFGAPPRVDVEFRAWLGQESWLVGAQRCCAPTR